MGWKLAELVERVGGVLHSQCHPGSSKRVHWNPGERQIRYYTTLGLLDRPSGISGQTGYYGPRHALQLLSIKALQSEGLSLKEIQHRLLGMREDQLARVAGLPDSWMSMLEAPPPDRERFWEQRPEPEEVRETPPDYRTDTVKLLPGAYLIVDPDHFRELDPSALREALRPLTRLLRERQRP